MPKQTALERKQSKLIKSWKSSLIPKPKRRKSKTKLPNPEKLRGKPYSEFLASDYWAEVRKRVLRRDNYRCSICKAEGNLQVHHTTYKHHFSEHKHLDDLMTLCSKCHQEHHYAQV